MVTWPKPKAFDIVWCRFPYGGKPEGSRHPGLVLNVANPPSEGQPVFLLIAGGTSANKKGEWTKALKSSDWLLQKPDVLKKAGLSNPTAIQFEKLQLNFDGKMTGGTLLTLPYTDRYFVAVPPSATPVAGHVDINSDAQLSSSFSAAAKYSNLKALIENEMTRYTSDPNMLNLFK